MTTSNIKEIIDSDIRRVWETILSVEKYSQWRSDLSKTEVINEKQFVEYTKDGFPTIFTITVLEPYKRWEFDIENSNIKGHWIGVFTPKGNKTQIDFTECVTVKKIIMRLFVKLYLRKQQSRFIMDLKKALD